MIPAPNDFFSDTEAAGLAEVLERVVLKEGEVLFREGEAADALFIVDRGSVRIELEREEIDSDAVLAQVSAGGIVGELGLLDGSPRSATAVADGPVELRRLSAENLSRLEETHPQQAAQVYRVLGAAAARKLRRSNSRLATALFEARDPEADRAVGAARDALPALAAASEEAVEDLLEALAIVFEREAEPLARLTVEVTGMGNIPHKVRKNHFASRAVRETLRGRQGFGLLQDGANGIVEVAAPAGVVFGLIPVTNPVATAIFKSLICLKSRNATILSFPRRAAEIGEEVCRLISGVLESQGWPIGLIQGVMKQNSRRRTEAFFHHPGVDLILATGGPSMVKAAYSSGRPALGVGPGNAPAFICEDADAAVAAAMVVESKSFDNGLICGSEHNLVVVQSIADDFRNGLEAAGAAVLDAAETGRFRTTVFTETESGLRRRFVGRSASELADAAGVRRSKPPRIIVVPASPDEARADHILACEKMAPVLSLFTVTDEEEGLELCRRLLSFEGCGHTAAIHTPDRGRAQRFALLMPASRIVVNTPATFGVIGLTSGLQPSLTLGCGLFGGNSTNDNVTYTHLRNIKRMAFHQPPAADS